MGEWGTQLSNAVAKIGTSIYRGGANIMTSLWDGMKSKWGQVESWFSTQLSWLRNQLPFSEPKDPASPLRGLGKSGESMIDMIRGGMDKASLTINPLADNLLAPATAGATTNNSVGQVLQNFHFYGETKPEVVSKAAADGTQSVLSQLRSQGVK